jgi:hypothetical protein
VRLISVRLAAEAGGSGARANYMLDIVEKFRRYRGVRSRVGS